MHDFGIFHQAPLNITVGEVTYNLLGLFDEKEIEWHDRFREFPHPFYIAVDENDFVVSFEEDPEHIQVPGFRLIGIDTDYGFTKQNVYQKKWNGEAIVDYVHFPVLDPRQLWLALSSIGVTQKNISERVEKIKDQEDREFIAIELNTSQLFKREFFCFTKFPKWLGLSESQFNDFWLHAATI